MAAKGTKAGSVYVEIALDREQFDKDFKAAGREVAAVQKQLSMEMERNKIKFAVEGVDKNWADKLFGNTVIGKIQQARKETEYLNTQIGFQKNKVDIARSAWDSITASKGALSGAAVAAEKSFLREQTSLVGLKKQLEGTTSASDIMGSTIKSAATTAAAATVALAAAYATATKAAAAWGQSVNDIVDETGMADESAARLMGTMNIVGISAEEAAGVIAKMAKSVNAAAKEQSAAAKSGKESEDVFTRFGIAIRGADGQLLDHETILANIQTVHGGMRDGLQKTAMEMEIFGKSGYKMNDYLNLSKEQMTEYTKRIDKMGLTIKDSQKYEDFNRQLNEMGLAFKGIAVTIAGDTVPQITKFIDKSSELATWIKENKDVLDEIRGVAWKGGEVLAYPFLKSLELASDAVKKYAALRKTELDSKKNPLEGDSTLDDVAAAAKMAKANAKKASDAAREKAALDKQLKESQRDLQSAILTLQGKTLEAQLINIEKERKAWLLKTQDEVAATKWAEESKKKAFQDALDARLGDEVKAAKEAIKNGTDVGEAIRKASEARKADEKLTYDARQAVKQYEGILAPGDTKSTLQVDALAGVITQLREIVKDFSIPKDKYGRTVFDPYQPTPAGQVIPGQNLTISVPVTVNVNGMDATSAQQLGEVAAQQLIPAVQQAIGGAQTQYGGAR